MTLTLNKGHGRIRIQVGRNIFIATGGGCLQNWDSKQNLNQEATIDSLSTQVAHILYPYGQALIH